MKLRGLIWLLIPVLIGIVAIVGGRISADIVSARINPPIDMAMLVVVASYSGTMEQATRWMTAEDCERSAALMNRNHEDKTRSWWVIAMCATENDR
jgi:hypothetical protein